MAKRTQKAKAKTIEEVYLNADEPHTPVMQKHIEDDAHEVAEEIRKKWAEEDSAAENDED